MGATRTLSPTHSCGHPRVQKGKHLCPDCWSKRRVSKRPRSVARRERALARIMRIFIENESLTTEQIATKLGVSTQRVLEMVVWLENYTLL